MSRIAFIGMGVMGAPMARHLAHKGHELTVYNRSPAKAERWVAENGGRMAASPMEAAERQDVVITCVGNDDDLAEVVLGPDGAIAAMKQGALFIDHTTVSAGIARRIAAEAERIGLLAVDAPVSGGQAGAEKGRLSIMCGGDADAIVDAVPVMQAYGGRIVHVGPPGAGQTTKAVNQICIAGLVQSLAEAIRFAQAAGLDSERVYEAVSGGAAQSWQMVNRWQTMDAGEFDFGFAVDWMRKDLAIALAEAKELGVELPVTELIDGYYAEVQQMGGGRQDTSSLIRRLPQGGAK
jgi:3-hydroxyisobutyrate dehydrogenase